MARIVATKCLETLFEIMLVLHFLRHYLKKKQISLDFEQLFVVKFCKSRFYWPGA